jgi:glyoxylase-like metal-dependent hydrolase (beta-lactamase superfamily II)
MGSRESEAFAVAPRHTEILRIVAPNPGPMTLEGTNTYLYGSEPCAVIDPGPDDAGHREAILTAAAQRGGVGVILLTHEHGDHSAGAQNLSDLAAKGSERPPVVLPPGDVPELRGRYGGLTSGTSGGGELRAIATPGHAADHVCLMTEDHVCFSGDLVLGEGSTFVPPDGGSLAAYMQSLHLLQAETIELMCPGHGPWIEDPAAKLAEYVEHREMRERRLLAALERGERSKAALLEEAWSDVPPNLRPAAAMVMDAHLQKLAAEGRVEAGALLP